MMSDPTTNHPDHRDPPSPAGNAPCNPGQFPATRWSLVLRAGDAQKPEGMDALESLCRAYWPPLYAYVRRRGCDVHESQDVIQGFIASLLERQDLQDVRPERGKFRSFLLASLNHYLLNELNRAQRQKRGGGKVIFSLDAAVDEGLPGIEPASHHTPETEFERRWAETVVHHVLRRLRSEWEQRFQPKYFDELKVYLLDDRGASPFAATAARIGITESSLKSTVHRLRKRFRELFREEIAGTVDDPSEVDGEIRHLIEALR